MSNSMSNLPLKEADITAQIRDYLDVRGCWHIKVLGHLGQKRGAPDILACLPGGRFLAIEVKNPKLRNRDRGGLSPDQELQLRLISQTGGIAAVAYDLEDVMDVVEPLLEYEHKAQKEGELAHIRRKHTGG